MSHNMQGKTVDRLDQFTSNDVPYIAPFNVVEKPRIFRAKCRLYAIRLNDPNAMG